MPENAGIAALKKALTDATNEAAAFKKRMEEEQEYLILATERWGTARAQLLEIEMCLQALGIGLRAEAGEAPPDATYLFQERTPETP